MNFHVMCYQLSAEKEIKNIQELTRLYGNNKIMLLRTDNGNDQNSKGLFWLREVFCFLS